MACRVSLRYNEVLGFIFVSRYYIKMSNTLYSSLRYHNRQFRVEPHPDIDKEEKDGTNGWLDSANSWLRTYLKKRFTPDPDINTEQQKDINVFKEYMLDYIENDHYAYSEYDSPAERAINNKRKERLITAVKELDDKTYKQWLGDDDDVHGGSKRRRRSNKSKRISKRNAQRRKTRHQRRKYINKCQ